jgi:deazaflavin-dependent oxidoreductase (nitroreductase family)
MNAFTSLHVFFYKLSGGRIGGTFRGAPVLLLSTTGRKTGKSRTTPLLYLIVDKNFAVVASNGGRDGHPSWWVNLKKSPDAEIQIKNEKKKVVAQQVPDDEKASLWPLLTKMYPTYDDYQKKTTRKIPVVLLKPTGEQ